MNSPTPPHPTPRRDIQGLRALAVLAVIGAHAAGWPRGGFVGVDVFFVVSGFLITGALLREVEATGGIRLGAFAVRRARRILPLALVVLITTAGLAFAVFHRTRADQTLVDALWSAGLAANWRFAAVGTDYFHADDAVSPLQHFWSLAVEEQFYLVWPLVLLAVVSLLPAAARRGRRAAVAVGLLAAALVLASFAWALVQSADAAAPAYFSTFTRAWELGVGALLAAVAPILRRLPAAAGGILSWVGVAGLVAAFAVIDPEAPGFPAPWAALPVAATALVLAGGMSGDPRHRHLFPLTNPVSVAIGDVSYSLYLWHFPVVVFAAVLLPARDATVVLVLAVTAILAVASYHLVEQPFRFAPYRLGADTSGRVAIAERDAAPSDDQRLRAPTGPATPPAAVPAPVPRVLSSRPAGWTPGTRYYPGMPRAGAADAPSEPAAVPPPATLAVAPSLAPAAAAPAAPVEPAEPAKPADAHPAASPWTVWRARFGPPAFLAASGLGIAALCVVLVVQNVFGGLVASPVARPPAEVADGAADAADAASDDPGDPVAALQAELAAAATATAWPDLHPSLDEVIARSSASNPARDCFAPEATPDAAACSTGSVDAPAHIYLVGDSTAMAYAPAFRKLADDSRGGIRVTTVGLYGCRFTDVAVQNDGAGVMAACPQRKADVRAMILADAPTLVVVSNAYTLGHTPDGADLSADALLAGQEAEAETYGLPGRIVHLAPPPEGADLGRCYAPASSPYGCAAGVSSTWAQMEAAAEQVAAASGNQAVSSLPFTCWELVCPAFAGDIPTRYDRTHLTVAYAEHIAPALRAEFAARGLL
ncbi:acyltransferase family protein [Microbacterium sp. cf332]|uniref:acyltransferase family protein n=1 Tax=Microbacterium sp. cf332 TaxID=1761804 RepID=UPI0008914DB2|nr:acyltransferase family protein [Microbacterium sp. cf332]SDQ29039.1 Peptidoglycan/LPS O-acetylase OafA/YrhL, contains acyltransferase and SGNH-hydrolase domains [Microbacterium sp. cf332]